MVRELNLEEIDAVNGGGRLDSIMTDAAAGALVGAAAGFLFGGPVGAVAGALSVGGHAALISSLR
ncbi:Blp family class II bacteriocin [uncultured Brevundimonas sp.]|uniref:Blp family class II bacteriocin n=1 Tax=uncultured Brevundimonas sp. TaxID=213418 RepID=UPI00341D1B4E